MKFLLDHDVPEDLSYLLEQLVDCPGDFESVRLGLLPYGRGSVSGTEPRL